MKKTRVLLIVSALLVPFQLSLGQEVEKEVAFKTADGKYISAALNSALDLGGTKIGSRQAFMLVDVNGGELADGDTVRITQTAGVEGGGTKIKGWKLSGGELKRGENPADFTVKKSGEMWTFQMKGGKFVGLTPTAVLGPVDTAEAALQVQIVDAKGKSAKAGASPAGATGAAAE